MRLLWSRNLARQHSPFYASENKPNQRKYERRRSADNHLGIEIEVQGLQRFQQMRDQAQGIVGDHHDGQPLHHLLQEELQPGAPVHGPQEIAVLLRDRDIHARAYNSLARATRCDRLSSRSAVDRHVRIAGNRRRSMNSATVCSPGIRSSRSSSIRPFTRA